MTNVNGNTVSGIDGQSQTVVGSIAVGSSPRGIAVRLHDRRGLPFGA